MVGGRLDEQLAFFQQGDDLVDTFDDTELVRGQGQGRIGRHIVVGGNSGEISDFTTIRLGVATLGIAFPADFHGGMQVNGQELILAHDLGCPLSDFLAGSDKSGNAEKPGMV